MGTAGISPASSRYMIHATQKRGFIGFATIVVALLLTGSTLGQQANNPLLNGAERSRLEELRKTFFVQSRFGENLIQSW
jgi:hypothetical protein